MSETQSALELKGRTLSLTRLRLLSADLGAVRSQLQEMSRQMPELAQGMPVIVDAAFAVDLAAIWQALRDVGMQPIAVAAGPLAEPARALGLVVLTDLPETRARKSPAPAAVTAGRKPARIVEQPVRSGQQIYAEGADLVVLGPVSAGAEVIADGCVHAYGAMRGRAIAGARGDDTARVFCRKFEAELVAVAGVYAVAEQMQGMRGFAVQALLQQGKLKIELMGA